MSKEKEWFKHEYGTRNKRKLAVLIEEEGSAGYGLFWIIVEMLYESRNKCMELDELTYLAIKKESKEDPSKIRGFIERCLNVYKVFIIHKQKFFTTEKVMENSKIRSGISKSRSDAGKKSAESRRKRATSVQQKLTLVEQTGTNSEQNPTEKRREEKNREEKRESNTDLPFENIVEDGLTKLKIEDCFTVARNDRKWMRESGATDEQLAEFNKVLAGRGEKWKNPGDYKSHFFNWKQKGGKTVPVVDTIQNTNAANLLRQQKANAILNG